MPCGFDQHACSRRMQEHVRNENPASPVSDSQPPLRANDAKNWDPPATLLSGASSTPSSSLLFSAARQQISSNERLQIAIDNAIHVTHFRFRTMVLDHPIGLQNVGANLRSKFDVELGVLDFLSGCAFLLHLKFV